LIQCEAPEEHDVKAIDETDSLFYGDKNRNRYYHKQYLVTIEHQLILNWKNIASRWKTTFIESIISFTLICTQKIEVIE
jgi:hypothetical protein